MTRSRPLAALAALALALAAALVQPGSAHAQAQGQGQVQAPPIGARVVDSKGKAVGRIERVIAGPDGRPQQALVRVDRVLRTLPVDALTPSGGVYASVLTRAEIAALPPSE
jgi:hypothetical protein